MFGKRGNVSSPVSTTALKDAPAPKVAKAPTPPVPKSQATAAPAPSYQSSAPREAERPAAQRSDAYYERKSQVFGALIDTIDLSQLAGMEIETAREEIRDIVNDIIAIKNYAMTIAEQEELLGDICNDVLGYGPLEPLLARDDIADIMVNGANQTFIEVGGKVFETNVRFRDNQQLLNIEGEGEITMRDLVKNCLRMRPERIIVGEVRGPEVFDLLQAMNTGHDGSMGTIHSNSPRECLNRIESMIAMGGFSLPSRTVKEIMVGSVDIIVQAARLRDGSRRITHITEVLGMEGDVIITQDLFVYDILGEDASGNLVGRHRSTGIGRPRFWDKARYYNEETRLAAALDASNHAEESRTS